ncbi:MAG: metallophosphoesterase [Clostridium sp.]|nr:metallophosphoesterase [Clostridium sp.]
MKKVILIIFIITAMLLWGFYIEPDMLTVKEYKISSPDFSGQNLRIVFASDFHLKKNQEKQARKITDKINSENPDIIILGGDFVKGDCPEKSMLPEHVAKELSNLKAPNGVYAVTGNHDSWYDEKRIISALEEKNISVLNNKNKKLELNGKTFYLAGIEDLTTGKPNLDKAFQNTSDPVIFVSHSPDVFPKNPYKPFLTLSGHTHGGQIRLPFFGALVVPSKYGNKYAQGKFEKGSQNLIVTKGLGTSILPFRFNCPPEIVVVEISGNTVNEEKLTYQYRFSLLDRISPKRNKVIKSFKITRDIAKNNSEAENIFWQKIKTSFDVSDLNDEEIYKNTGLIRYNQIIMFDLDGDSQDEIIGINKSQIGWGHMNYGLLILKKKGNDYEIIADIRVREEHDEIKISEHKTNGFHDIKLSNAENDVPEKTLAFY